MHGVGGAGLVVFGPKYPFLLTAAAVLLAQAAGYIFQWRGCGRPRRATSASRVWRAQ